MNELEPKKITLNFTRFLDYVLRDREKVVIHHEEAVQVTLIDKDESLVHVQWDEKGKPLATPILWRIADWRTEETRQKQLKRISELSRSGVSKIHSNIQKVIELLHKQTKLPKESLTEVAKVIILNKNADTEYLKKIGIDFADLTEEEKLALRLPQKDYHIL